MIRVAAALALLATVAASDDPLKGRRVAGPPQRCLQDDGMAVAILDRDTIAYSRTARRSWITHPAGPCPSLRRDSTVVVVRYGGPLCEGDRFRTIEPTSSIPSAPCRFGPFTPYDRVR